MSEVLRRFQMSDEQANLFWEEINDLEQIEAGISKLVRDLLEQQQKERRAFWKRVCKVAGISESEFNTEKISIDWAAKEILLRSGEERVVEERAVND